MRRRCSWRACFIYLAVFVAAPCANRAMAAGESRVRLSASELFDKAIAEGVRLSADGKAIELQRGQLIEDDGPAAGFSYKPNEEKLADDVWAKKELIVPDARVSGATLLVGGSGMLQFQINGKAETLPKIGKAGNYWEMYQVPADALRTGKNEIVLHGPGKLWIARDDEFAIGQRGATRGPNRSQKSIDGGKTWRDDGLGAKNDVDGEYYVRLFLDQHRPKGALTLPVVDLGDLANELIGKIRPVGIAPVLAELSPVVIDAKCELGPSGKLRAYARSGTTYSPSADWSAWQELTGNELAKPRGRYAQFRIELETTDPRDTPLLQAVTLTTTVEPASDWTKRLEVIKADNPPVVRTSIPFEYEQWDQPKLKALRQQHKLDDVVRGAKNDFEIITRLALWSSQLWKKGHLGEAYPPWCALDILKPHADGTPVGGFCHQYHLVFLQACESLGLVGRAVSLSPGSLIDKPQRSGHEVVEIWSNDHRKWVYVDGQFAWYAVDEMSSVPLSLWELRRRQLAVLNSKPTAATRIVHLGEQRTWTSLDRGTPFVELRLIPRSNFLEQASPLPLNQGMRGWFWTGHQVWTDDTLPAALLYGNRVEQRGNFEWTVNHAHIVLEPTTTPGELRVHLDTETPGFETFLVSRVVGADEIATGPEHQKAAVPEKSGFIWKLEPGLNALIVRPRNTAGREGAWSSVLLNYLPRP